MRPILFAAFPLTLLTACASDNYAALPGTNPALYPSALKACKQQAIDSYFQGNQAQGAATGVAGAFGGAIGGGIVGLASGASRADQINPNIAACMRAKGFEGESHG